MRKPKIALITPTCERPEAFSLCERWMARQTMKFHQWIVVDGGNIPEVTSMGQAVIRQPSPPGVQNFIRNVLAAIPEVDADLVLVIENDDYYRPNHIETCVGHLAKHRATGCTWLDYYNVQHRSWRRLRNSCAALCNTAFRAECLPMLEQAARDALRRNIYHVDRLFWQQVGKDGLHEEETVVGIKGLPGRVGIGLGHRPGAGWIKDDGRKLREWIGSDAAYYLPHTGVMK